jgi:hypothetical protein
MRVPLTAEIKLHQFPTREEVLDGLLDHLERLPFKCETAADRAIKAW